MPLVTMWYPTFIRHCQRPHTQLTGQAQRGLSRGRVAFGTATDKRESCMGALLVPGGHLAQCLLLMLLVQGCLSLIPCLP